MVTAVGVLLTLMESRATNADGRVLFTPAGIYQGIVVTLGKMIGGVDYFEIQSHLGMLMLVGIMFMSMLINATYTVKCQILYHLTARSLYHQANLASILTKRRSIYGVESNSDLQAASVCFSDWESTTNVYTIPQIEAFLPPASKRIFAGDNLGMDPFEAFANSTGNVFAVLERTTVCRRSSRARPTIPSHLSAQSLT